MKILKLSFWYDDGGINLRPMPPVCVDDDIEKWFKEERRVGITHRINVPDEINWRHFFEEHEIINENDVFYKLNEERLALFILTHY